eukprot:2094475-Karenia_brevis.AAC.1
MTQGVEGHPKTLRQERSKRQREVLDDYPVEAFKRQSTAPAVMSMPRESRASASTDAAATPTTVN